MSRNIPQRSNTKSGMIAELANSGKTRREAFNALRELVLQQIEPMVFKANVNGSRIAKPISQQLLMLAYEINRVFRILEIQGEDLDMQNEEDEILGNDEIREDDFKVEEEEESPEEEIVEDEDEEETPKIVKSSKQKILDTKRHFLNEVRRIRNFCQSRALSGETIDWISMRPAQAGSRLIPAGVPVEGLLAAMTLHWPDGAKRDADIPNFDFVKFSQSVMKSRGIEAGTYHDLFGYALILAECRQPIMLVGEYGTGKSHIAEQLAEYLDVPYAEAPMSPGATRGDLLGRHTVEKFVEAEFPKVYEQGGVFLFDEFDASDASMVIMLNNALAKTKLFNTVSGNHHVKDEGFIPVAAANTFGLGATREYVARERQDAATLDRWRMGRMVVGIDERVEEKILGL